MNFKLVHRITGWIVFLFSTVVYFITVQPTMSFWDCGEFAACAYTLGIPHPPGAPLHILVGRIFTMIPSAADIALRMNYLSVLAGGLSVLLLYLVSVRVIRNWRGNPNNWFDVLVLTIPSAIGALSLGFGDSFWFNAVEAEVYSFGTLLLCLTVYYTMVWWDNSDKPGSDKYLLLIAYLAGLSLGIHLLVVQVVFLAGLMFYFKRYEFTLKGFLIGVAGSMFAFFIFYPFITKKLPALISSFPAVGFLGILFVLMGLILWSFKAKNKVLNLAFLAIFLAIVGYSTYISVYMRSGVSNMPIDQNNPDNMERLLSYLNREQYGEQPLIWPRRYSHEPQHQPTWSNYSSDVDFMLSYQINKMFNRYVFWQYIGRAGYNNGDGVDASKFFAIPFLIGMIGIFYHFRRDKKLAFIFLSMFLLMGVVTALYQNQQDPQPRERDYFYIGAFYAFSLWIAIGIVGIIEMLQEYIKSKAYITAGVVFMLLGIIFIPLRMLQVNYKYQTRENNYFPYDYAYNMLQSCEKDAILITNGDNDTFPLWAIQAMYGVRTDVRIVNLSLAQIDWYNLQLKNEKPYGAKTVPMTYTDAALKELRPVEWKAKKITIDIPKSAYPESMKNNQNLPDKLTWEVPPSLNVQQQGKNVSAIKTNDLIVLDIVKANKWERPINFSITVTEENWIGLQDYVQLEGMTYKLVPYKTSSDETRHGVNKELTAKMLLEHPSQQSKDPQTGFFIRGINDPNIFYDQNHRRMIDGQYRQTFIDLAFAYANDSDFVTAKKVLDELEKEIPLDLNKPIHPSISYMIASVYAKIGDKAGFERYAGDMETELLKTKARAKSDNALKQFYNPYRMLLDIYVLKEDYKSANSLLDELETAFPNAQEIKIKRQSIQSKAAGK